MKVEELKMMLNEEGFSPDTYSIDGPLPAYEGLILTGKHDRWRLEFFERGVVRELASFDNENAACDQMFELMKRHFRAP